MGKTAHRYSVFNTRAGFCGVAWNSIGISRFQRPSKSAEAAERNLLRRLAGSEPGTPTSEVAEAIAAAQRYFEGEQTDFSRLMLDL